MSPWIIGFLYLVLFLCLAAIVITSVMLIIVRKHRKRRVKPMVISLAISIFLAIVLLLFAISHSTYYRYNDWAILQSNIYMVQQKYGTFDVGTIKENQAGRVAYYIYTDNGPIMPDHLKHYYYIEYDEWGVVYKVYESSQLGG